jgi:hypothetical protein
MRKAIEAALYVLCAGIVLGVIAYTLAEQRACDARGGQLVRGVLGYECIVTPGR